MYIYFPAGFIIVLRRVLPLFRFARFAYFPRRFRPPRVYRVSSAFGPSAASQTARLRD